MSEKSQYTNNSNVPISLALWLAYDNYDHDNDPTHISATALLKPLKQIILAPRVPKEASTPDVLGQVASRIGTAIHNAIENAWVNNYKEIFPLLGYPNKLINRIKINPTKEELTEDTVPVYLEKRSSREIDGFTVTGKFDFVIEGAVRDFKKTKTYAYINGSNEDKYQLQGSIYRWLNEDIITSDDMWIDFIFVDWMASKVAIDPKYPKTEVIGHKIPLLPIPNTEYFIKQKLASIVDLHDAKEEDIPNCTDEDLWRKAPVWKYYKNPDKLSRSTKNFDNSAEANTRLITDGNVGIIKEIKGEVIACRYCIANTICKQAASYILNGTLKL